MTKTTPPPLAGVRIIESSLLGPGAITTHLADWHSVLAGYEGAYEPPDPAERDLETVKLIVKSISKRLCSF